MVENTTVRKRAAWQGSARHLVKPIAFGDLHTVIEQLTRGVTRTADGTLPVN